jgi:hypothetical protein
VHTRDQEWAATADDVLRLGTTPAVRDLDTEEVRAQVRSCRRRPADRLARFSGADEDCGRGPPKP